MGERLAQQEARAAQGGERVHAVVDQPCQDCSQSLWLAIGPLRAVERVWLPVLKVDAGVQGVERTLAAPQYVWARRVETERRAAIDQGDIDQVRRQHAQVGHACDRQARRVRQVKALISEAATAALAD